MSPSRNKFGFEPMDPQSPAPKRDRSVGPMGAAVRDAASSLQDATEAKVEQRRRNAEDAKSFRAAQEDGRLLEAVPVDAIHTDDLPRDRLELDAVEASDDMEELKTSIRARGQREPIEIYRDGQGVLQLKKGWRRLTALRQLHAETGDEQFANVIARIEVRAESRLDRYVDMVEENVVRENLTFAEMAQVAVLAAQDSDVDEGDPDAMVSRLYASLHKMKRSYIRSFVFLLIQLGDSLKWPKAVSRNLGVDVSRSIRSVDGLEALKQRLETCDTSDAQNETLARFVSEASEKSGAGRAKPKPQPKEKREFHVGKMKITARKGECRIVAGVDFASLPKGQLERAIEAFEEALEQGNPRVTSL